MVRTLFFLMVQNFWEFWSLFNHCQKCQSNQEQYGLCCSLPCFCVLLCTHIVMPFNIFFVFLKKSEFYGVKFQTICCDWSERGGRTFQKLSHLGGTHFLSFLIHYGSVQKMLTVLSNFVWILRKINGQFFWSAQARCFLVLKKFLKR